MPTVEQPCVRKCCLNDEDVCLGCFRTFDDMLVWNTSTQSQKVQMLNNAKKRQQAVEKKRGKTKKADKA